MSSGQKKKQALLPVLAILILTILACGESVTPTSIPTNTPHPTGTAKPIDTSTLEPTDMPTDTPEPEPTRTPEPSVPIQELEDTWRTPLLTAALTMGAYESLLDTADKLQTEEIDGTTALGEVIGAGALLKAVEDTLADWEPAADQTEYKTVIQNYVDTAQGVIGQWLDKKITSADIPGLLENSYSASQDTLQDIMLTAKDEGLDEDALLSMLDELAQALEAEEPVPADTPTPEPFPSGGLGASKAQWEQEHTEGETIFAMIEYDNGAYLVTFVDDKIQYLELTVTDGLDLDNARTRAETFIPEDSQFQETYSPEGFPELIVDLYTSESLGKRFTSDWVWFDSGPGTFIVIYSIYDGKVARILMATGNNP